VVNTYPSNLFGLAVGSSFQLLSANMAIGSLDPSYIVNVLSVTVKYLPAYGRSALTGATFGAGEGYAGFQQNFILQLLWLLILSAYAKIQDQFTQANLS
jgi:hypothetical protein